MRDTGVCAVPDVQGQDLPAFCIYCLGPMAFSGIRMGRKYHKGERQSKIKSGWGKGWGHGKWENKSSEWNIWVSKQHYALNLTISNQHSPWSWRCCCSWVCETGSTGQTLKTTIVCAHNEWEVKQTKCVMDVWVQNVSDTVVHTLPASINQSRFLLTIISLLPALSQYNHRPTLH